MCPGLCPRQRACVYPHITSAMISTHHKYRTCIINMTVVLWMQPWSRVTSFTHSHSHICFAWFYFIHHIRAFAVCQTVCGLIFLCLLSGVECGQSPLSRGIEGQTEVCSTRPHLFWVTWVLHTVQQENGSHHLRRGLMLKLLIFWQNNVSFGVMMMGMWSVHCMCDSSNGRNCAGQGLHHGTVGGALVWVMIPSVIQKTWMEKKNFSSVFPDIMPPC